MDIIFFNFRDYFFGGGFRKPCCRCFNAYASDYRNKQFKAIHFVIVGYKVSFIKCYPDYIDVLFVCKAEPIRNLVVVSGKILFHSFFEIYPWLGFNYPRLVLFIFRNGASTQDKAVLIKIESIFFAVFGSCKLNGVNSRKRLAQFCQLFGRVFKPFSQIAITEKLP